MHLPQHLSRPANFQRLRRPSMTKEVNISRREKIKRHSRSKNKDECSSNLNVLLQFVSPVVLGDPRSTKFRPGHWS